MEIDRGRTATTTISSLIEWGKSQPLVRALILTSTRAVPGAAVDILSDYDVILIVRDVLPFHEDRAWLEAFGPVMAMYHDPLVDYRGLPSTGFVTQYQSGLKIDYTVWPVETLQGIVSDPRLPDELDAGYRVLLDKDHLTDRLRLPTYTAYIPTPPTKAKYLDTIEEFFLDATYVAKYLWRDDPVAAKHVLDVYMKQEHLLPILQWRIEMDQQWSARVGIYGRGLKRQLSSDLWAELENTYTGIGANESWQALFRTIALLRRVAIEVGDRLGYTYPQDLERQVLAYIEQIQTLDPSDHPKMTE